MNTPGTLHALGAGDDWRLRDAATCEAKVRLLADALRLLDELHALFEADRDPKAATEARSFCGLLRDRAAAYTEHARELRSQARDEPRPELPRAVTTRRADLPASRPPA